MTAKGKTTQSERVTLQLRQLILGGAFPPGSHLAEIPLAERLGASRSPVRLALTVLEHEGLLASNPRRGFVVRNITLKEISDGFEVRAALEALACRQAIEQGLDTATKVALHECLEEGEQLLRQGSLAEGDTAKWSAMNGRFHDSIIKASRNTPLCAAHALNAARPLISASAIAFNTVDLTASYKNMRGVHAEHVEIVDALLKRDAKRAERSIVAHARHSSANLIRLLEAVRTERQTPGVPGLGLMAE